MSKRRSDTQRRHPPAYLSRSELRHQLSLSDPVIDRMIKKGLLPPPDDLDGNDRWRWEDVDAFIVSRRAGELDLPDASDEDDEVLKGIRNVTQKAQD